MVELRGSEERGIPFVLTMVRRAGLTGDWCNERLKGVMTLERETAKGESFAEGVAD